MTTTACTLPCNVPQRAVSFKRDVARRIDRVIDYFGASPKRDHPRSAGATSVSQRQRS